MKLKVGDRVKFLNDSGGGTVSEIVDQKIVKVLTEDGFEIPVMARELIKPIEPGEYENINPIEHDAKKIPKNIQEDTINEFETILPENISKNARKDVLLGLVPENEENAATEPVDLFLINDSSYALIYKIGVQENVSWHYLRTGFLEPDTKLYIHTFDQSAISKIKNLHIQLLYMAKGKYFPQPPVEKYVGLDSYRFYKENTFKENDYFDEKALVIPLTVDLSDKLEASFGEELAKAMMEKNDLKKETAQPVSNANPSTEEVDLHIEAITDQFAGLSAGEILEMQMNRFYTSLEGGIINKTQRMVFIHGVGNGKLKYEITKALEEKYPDLKYQDASFKEYGYGATMIYLK